MKIKLYRIPRIEPFRCEYAGAIGSEECPLIIVENLVKPQITPRLITDIHEIVPVKFEFNDSSQS